MVLVNDRELGGPPADGAFSSHQVSRHRDPPGRDQEGAAGAGTAGGPGALPPQPAPGGATDQGHLRRPLHPGPGEGEPHREPGDYSIRSFVLFEWYCVVMT